MKKKVEAGIKVKDAKIQENETNKKQTTNKKNIQPNKKTSGNGKGQDIPLRKKKKNKKLRKSITIFVLSIFAIILFALILSSDLFNIKKITVQENSKVSESEILEVANLNIGENTFKHLSESIKRKIKTLPYIEEVKIKKKLNGEIIITVKERTATFMLECENGYAYINNQGYILEESEIPIELPVIKGYETEEVIPGKRLIEKDLEKLDILIQIMETAKSNGIGNIITGINIAEKGNFILEIPSKDKTVQFGDETNISVKILWIIDLLERTEGIPGEIVLNVPNIKKVYFREKV